MLRSPITFPPVGFCGSYSGIGGGKRGGTDGERDCVGGPRSRIRILNTVDGRAADGSHILGANGDLQVRGVEEGGSQNLAVPASLRIRTEVLSRHCNRKRTYAGIAEAGTIEEITG